MRWVRKIGQEKAKLRLPIGNAAVEEQVKILHQRVAKEQGLPDDLTRELSQLLIRYARREQKQVQQTVLPVVASVGTTSPLPTPQPVSPGGS